MFAIRATQPHPRQQKENITPYISIHEWDKKSRYAKSMIENDQQHGKSHDGASVAIYKWSGIPPRLTFFSQGFYYTLSPLHDLEFLAVYAGYGHAHTAYIEY